jgi:hypothetical protein
MISTRFVQGAEAVLNEISEVEASLRLGVVAILAKQGSVSGFDRVKLQSLRANLKPVWSVH